MAVIDGKWLSKEGLTYFWSKIKSIFTKQTETNVIANLGAKNLFDIQHPSTTKSTTYNETSDGGVELTCSNAAWTQYIITDTPVELDRDYVFTLYVDSISGTNTFKVYIRNANDSGTILYRSDNISAIQTLTTTITPSARIIWVGIYLNNSATAKTASAKIRAMLRPAEITDDTFEPYAPTNRELYDAKTDQTETNAIANLGAKNLFPNMAVSQTIGGVTFTVNDDGTVTVNGTKTNNDWFILSENNSFDAGTYTLSDGLPNDTTDCQLIISTARSMGAAIMATAVNSRPQTKTFTTAQTGLYYAIRIANGKTVNNLTFKPMIRRAEITDGTYVPYAPTNRELYETRFASKTILPDDVDLNNIKTGGIYNGVNSTGNSAVHMPVATGSFNFVLTVIEANEFIIQIFKQLNSAGDPNFYVRRFYIYNSDWDSWYQFTGTQV